MASLAELRRLYEVERLTIAQVAERTGIPASTVHRRLHAAGAWVRTRQDGARSLDEQALLDTAFLYERMGMSVQEIADALGRSHETIRERLRKAGVEMRPRGVAVSLKAKRRREAGAAGAGVYDARR